MTSAEAIPSVNLSLKGTFFAANALANPVGNKLVKARTDACFKKSLRVFMLTSTDLIEIKVPTGKLLSFQGIVMKTSIFVALLVFCTSNIFANQWFFSIPRDTQFPIQIFNTAAGDSQIKIIDLIRNHSGIIYEARLTYENARFNHPSGLLEQYATPTYETWTPHNGSWVDFWKFVDSKGLSTAEILKALNPHLKVKFDFPEAVF
jgi:hypothetical protein